MAKYGLNLRVSCIRLVELPKKAFLIHKVAWRSTSQRFEHQHISHLCDERACFNPTHLCNESAEANNRRKGCPGDVTCKCCTATAFECPHIPKCIRLKK